MRPRVNLLTHPHLEDHCLLKPERLLRRMPAATNSLMGYQLKQLHARYSVVFICSFQIGQIRRRVHKTVATQDWENYKDLGGLRDTHLFSRIWPTLLALPALQGYEVRKELGLNIPQTMTRCSYDITIPKPQVLRVSISRD